MWKSKLPGLFAIALISVALNSCTSMLLVKSSWNSDQMKVNGNDSDWGDTMFYIPDAQLTTGVRNDGNYVYLILKSTDRRQAFQILGLGMTVWFDPTGGSGKTFGIHFPIGRMAGGQMSRRRDTGGMQVMADTSEMNQGFAMRTPNEVELLGVSPNGPVRMSVADLKGIELQLHTDRQGLIYELRVPLHASPDQPYAINAKGPQIGIGFVGGKFEMPAMRSERRSNGGGEGGGMPGEGGEGVPGEGGQGYPDEGGESGGGYGTGGRRQFQQGQFQAPKQIDFWLKADLASSSSQAG